jgi:hypothetical protein
MRCRSPPDLLGLADCLSDPAAAEDSRRQATKIYQDLELADTVPAGPG